MGCFQILANANNAAMNIGTHIFFQICVSVESYCLMEQLLLVFKITFNQMMIETR